MPRDAVYNSETSSVSSSRGSTESAQPCGNGLAPIRPPVNASASTGGFCLRIRDAAAQERWVEWLHAIRAGEAPAAGVEPAASPQPWSVAPGQGRAVASMSNRCNQQTASRRGEVQGHVNRGRTGDGPGGSVECDAGRLCCLMGYVPSVRKNLNPRGCHPSPKYPAVNSGEKQRGESTDSNRPTFRAYHTETNKADE